MPTVFIQNGYRASFYSDDVAERMHVHIFKAGRECDLIRFPPPPFCLRCDL